MKFIFFLISVLKLFIYIECDTTIDVSTLSDDVEIAASGTYILTGTSSTASFEIADSLTNVNLIFNTLSLSSSSKTLLTIGSSSSVNIQISQDSTLSATGYTAVTLNSNSELSINGSSTLNVIGTYGLMEITQLLLLLIQVQFQLLQQVMVY